jgi:hypothetical protein
VNVTKFFGDVLDAHEGLGGRIAPGTGVDGKLGLFSHQHVLERIVIA